MFLLKLYHYIIWNYIKTLNKYFVTQYSICKPYKSYYIPKWDFLIIIIYIIQIIILKMFLNLVYFQIFLLYIKNKRTI